MATKMRGIAMPHVDENRQKGNFAENIAAAWLSRQCLVRPVATGTDVGVDLYCESLVGTSPFQHFWVQVKAIPHTNIRSLPGHEEAWYDFETRHLRYWQRQPVPVYAFLVPVLNWPPPFPTRIYGIKISDRLVREGIPDQAQVRYTTSEWFDVEAIDVDLRQFVTRVVPVDTVALLLPKGIVPPIEWPDEREETHYLRGLAVTHIDTIEDAIRQTAEMCLAELIEAGPDTTSATARRRRFESILCQYEATLTALGASAVANSAFLDSNHQKARRFLKLAESRTLSSKVDEATRKSRLEKIRQMMARLG
jgi:hypothetical protein